MKHLFNILFLFISINLSFSQTPNEFGLYSNGLIYSDTTIGQLKYIVDSLNLQFKTCDLSKNYKPLPTYYGQFIKLEKSNFNSDRRIAFFTVGYGDEGEFNPEVLKQIAELNGGYYRKGDPETISTLMEDLQVEF